MHNASAPTFETAWRVLPAFMRSACWQRCRRRFDSGRRRTMQTSMHRSRCLSPGCYGRDAVVNSTISGTRVWCTPWQSLLDAREGLFRFGWLLAARMRTGWLLAARIWRECKVWEWKAPFKRDPVISSVGHLGVGHWRFHLRWRIQNECLFALICLWAAWHTLRRHLLVRCPWIADKTLATARHETALSAEGSARRLGIREAPAACRAPRTRAQGFWFSGGFTARCHFHIIGCIFRI